MNPEVTAAIIAAGVSILTLIGTLAAQYLGRRATSRDTRQALEEQRKWLERSLAEQRTRTLNERFATAAEQLGSDKPAVRLAGVYAMAGLADDWEENRQTCVDVLCAYLRMPYEPDPGHDAPEPQRLAFQAIREVRHAVIRAITMRLRDGAPTSWQSLNFDFRGVVFDGGDFSGARFSSGRVHFTRARFTGGTVDFSGAGFSGGTVDFGGVEFCGGMVEFSRARFSSGTVYFGAWFSGGMVDFRKAQFSGGTVLFNAQFSGGTVSFGDAEFSGGRISFGAAQFSGGTVHFSGAEFSGGTVHFSGAEFSGGTVDFSGARFSGGAVDFSDASDWSFPPEFPWYVPPSGVKLPKKQEDPSQA